MKLIDYLRERNIDISAYCNGSGTCGKCKVKGLTDFPVTPADIRCLTEEERIKGIRLSCQVDVTDQNLPFIKSLIDSNAAGDVQKNLEEISADDLNTDSEGTYSIAIDIGTTTVAFALVGKNGDIVDSTTDFNPQKKYGADVLSRIKAANEGKLEELNELIIYCINKNINLMLVKNKLISKMISTVIISANVTMVHLLLGMSCESLAKYPFKPFKKDMEFIFINKLFNRSDFGDKKAIILPSIAPFVGGDIVSGIYSTNMVEENDISLLIDLGTNGEIVLGNNNKILTCSTAAGPAFEGCNISCGIASISGAITNTYIIGRNRLGYKTIGGHTPIGICGTGLIDLVSDLIDIGVIDRNGQIIDKYFDNGYPIIADISLKQKDIRELQVAKSAIRAGIEVLVNEYGIKIDEINKVYISGGFSSGIDVNKAVNIALLPKELNCEVVSIGNSSLNGAIKLIEKVRGIDSDLEYDMATILAYELNRLLVISDNILLAENDNFNDCFLEYMSF